MMAAAGDHAPASVDDDGFTFGGPVDCPSCGHHFIGCWVDRRTGEQRCDACGWVFEATWPGFQFEPETIVLRPDGEEPGDDVA